MRKVEVVPYDAKWIALFESEANLLRSIFGTNLAAIHHIGSTSVRGLAAKPIVDVMPVVIDIVEVDDHNDAMRHLGYESMGENGIPGRRYFQKGGDSRTHHVHIFQIGSEHIERHLAVRDYLRVHPDTADAYAKLKLQLAKCFPTDIESYITGKAQLVQDIEQQAVAWYRNHSKQGGAFE